MASHKSVLNISRNYRMKFKRAERGISQCALAWVEYGVSVRDMTLAESIAARNDQARMQEPLPFAELPGLSFEPPASAADRARDNNLLVWAASRFVAEEMYGAHREA